jgi:riboflavin synthase
MFSGLIAYRGTVVALEERAEGGATLRVRCEGVEQEAPAVKDSVAIDGVCLTVVATDADTLAFEVVPETLARSTLGERAAGDTVNVEYALRIGDRLGGHFVYGHVDGVASVLGRVREGQGQRIRIEPPPALVPMIAEKAFIAIDGVSLTVAGVNERWFEIALVPETLARTTLGARPAGSRVNLEVDPLARYSYHAVRGAGER